MKKKMVTGGELRNQSSSDEIQETLRVWNEVLLSFTGGSRREEALATRVGPGWSVAPNDSLLGSAYRPRCAERSTPRAMTWRLRHFHPSAMRSKDRLSPLCSHLG
jgi:hypothetical protein